MVVIVVCLSAGCGGGGGDSKAAETPAERLDEWLGTWSDDVERGERPNDFSVPAPPSLQFGAVAREIQQDVGWAAFDLELVELAPARLIRTVFCTWFGWFVVTGHSVPMERELEDRLISEGFGLPLLQPQPQPVEQAVSIFRASIVRAQNADEATEKEAVAAVCSLRRPDNGVGV
jgi:hypothetical protein